MSRHTRAWSECLEPAASIEADTLANLAARAQAKCTASPALNSSLRRLQRPADGEHLLQAPAHAWPEASLALDGELEQGASLQHEMTQLGRAARSELDRACVRIIENEVQQAPDGQWRYAHTDLRTRAGRFSLGGRVMARPRQNAAGRRSRRSAPASGGPN